jgi:hypothetical protein
MTSGFNRAAREYCERLPLTCDEVATSHPSHKPGTIAIVASAHGHQVLIRNGVPTSGVQ